MRRPLVAGGIVVGLLLPVTLLVALRSGPAPPAAVPAAQSAEPSGPAGVAPGPAVNRDLAADAPRRSQSVAPVRYQRRIRVIDGTHRGIAGIAVAAVGPDGMPCAAPMLSGADGFLSWSATEPRATLAATGDGRYGIAVVPLDVADDFTLIADPADPVTIEVADPRGHPVVGLDVTFFLLQGELTRPTDDAGRVTFPVPPEQRPPFLEHRFLRNGARSHGLDLALPFPFETGRLTEADRARGRVLVRVPSGAPVEVVLAEESGVPFGAPAFVWVRGLEDVRDAAPLPHQGDGRYRLPWWPLGGRMRVDAVAADGSRGPATCVADGPRASGRTVEIDLMLPAAPGTAAPQGVVLVVEPVVPAMESLEGWWVEGWIEGPSASPTAPAPLPVCPARLAGGRAELRVDEARPPNAPATLHVIARDSSRPDVQPHRGQVVVTGRLLPGRTELGRVHLAPIPLAVAGRVVDPKGHPLAGAQVTLDDLSEDAVRDSCDTGVDGTFFFWCEEGAARYRVLVQHPRCFPIAAVDCVRGTTGLDVVALPCAAVAGRLLLDPELPPKLFSVLLHQGREARQVEVDLHGRYVAADLHGRRTMASVRLAGATDPLLVVDVGDLAAGVGAEPLPLPDLDLRGRLRHATVTLRDARGAPVAGVSLHVREGTTVADDTDHAGRVEVVAPAFPVRVVVLDRQRPRRAAPLVFELAGDEEVILPWRTEPAAAAAR